MHIYLVYLVLNEQTGLLLFLFLLVLVTWKPETLPTIARKLGKWYSWARKSLNEFLKELNEPIYEMSQLVMNDVDLDILRIARALNIDVRGKTRQEVINEILKKLGEGKNG